MLDQLAAGVAKIGQAGFDAHNGLSVWLLMFLQWGLAYYVYKDSLKRQVPNRTAWFIFTFIFWPVFFPYLYYRYHAKQREAEMTNRARLKFEHQKKMNEQARRLREERREWEKLRKIEMEKNRETMALLDEEQRKKAAEKEQRMRELEEERRLQEEAAAEILRLRNNARIKI